MFDSRVSGILKNIEKKRRISHGCVTAAAERIPSFEDGRMPRTTSDIGWLLFFDDALSRRGEKERQSEREMFCIPIDARKTTAY